MKKSPSVITLCNRWGSQIPELAIIKAINSTFPGLKMTKPPIDVYRFATQREITIRYKKMTQDGIIFKIQGGGYQVELNKDHSEVRRRFTCAHEIGHTFFFNANDRNPNARIEERNLEKIKADVMEEYLCNIAAAEILMPYDSFSAYAKSFGPSVKSIIKLSRIFRTSLWATSRRLVQILPYKLTIVLWDNFSVSKCYKSSWIVASASNQSLQTLILDRSVPICKSFDSKPIFRGKMWVSLGGPIEDYFVDGMRIRSSNCTRILTMFILETFADKLFSNSSNQMKKNKQLLLFD